MNSIFPYINILGIIIPTDEGVGIPPTRLNVVVKTVKQEKPDILTCAPVLIFMIMIMCNSAPPYESEERGEALSLLESSKASTLACNSWCAASQLGNMTGKRLGGQGRRTIIEYH